MRSFVASVIAVLARRILAKYRPTVVGVTGSVGKTATKDAVFAVLSKRFRVRRSRKNYNTEFGVPLTVIGLESPGKNPLGWLLVLLRGAGLLLFREEYPEVLVLELGVDRPGDMARHLGVAAPTIGVLTAISPAHLQNFASFEDYAAEKEQLITALPEDGLAVLNADVPRAVAARARARCPVVAYGLAPDADLRALALQPSMSRPRGEEGIAVAGMDMKVAWKGQLVPVTLREAIAPAAAQAALAAVAVGMRMGLNLLECVEGLAAFTPPPGRMRVLPGIKYTTLIDDTYNSSPLAADHALRTLRAIELDEDDRRIAVLGDMLELGSDSERLHREVGALAAQLGLDMLVTVGERSRDAIRAAREAGFPESHLLAFSTPEEAGRYLQGIIKIGDVLLMKGSQGARMEKVVRELMAEPLRAPQLLVRQEPPWVT